MVAKKKATTGKGQVKKLKLKRETIRDLGAKGRNVKGGARVRRPETDTCGATCGDRCSAGCI